MENNKKKLQIPSTCALLFMLMIVCAILTWIVPAGEFDTEKVDNLNKVIAGTYHTVEASPVGPWATIMAVVQGFYKAAKLMVMIMFVGGAVEILEKTGAIHAAFGKLASKQNLNVNVLVFLVSESLVLDFADTDKLSWPVTGNIVLGYCMDTTTYFPTLDQYKVNPANVIQSEVSTPVSAPADARVVSVGTNEEIGNYVDLDLGNGYTAVCGQLKEIPVVENEYVRQGDLLGYVAEPTKYYAVEGTNVFFEFLKDGVPVDALDFLE